MAIDTIEKRQNIAGAGRVFMRSHFPVATPDDEWRIASGIAYGGNVIAGPPVPQGPGNWTSNFDLLREIID